MKIKNFRQYLAESGEIQKPTVADPKSISGPIINKIYSATASDTGPLGTPVTFNMKVTSIKNERALDGSWSGFALFISSEKGESMDILNVDCNSINRYIQSKKASQTAPVQRGQSPNIIAYGESEWNWYFNDQFLTDLKQTLTCTA
jgi:hypothetical protein